MIAASDCEYYGTSMLDTCNSGGGDSTLLGWAFMAALLVMAAVGVAAVVKAVIFALRHRNPAALSRARKYIDSSGEVREIEERLIPLKERASALTSSLYSSNTRLSDREKKDRQDELGKLKREIRQLKKALIKIKTAKTSGVG